MKILYVNDEDSYASMWINGEKQFHSSDNYNVIDCLELVEKFVNNSVSPIHRIELLSLTLEDARTSDIPDSVNDFKSLQTWYQETTGKELKRE